MYQALTTRARDHGSRPPPSFLAQPLGKNLQAPAPSWPPTPGSLPSHTAPAHRSAASKSPTAATKGSSAPCPPPPSPHCAPTPSPRPTTSTNATKANRLGPGRPRPGPPPHPDPARHNPRGHPLQPTTRHEITHRRLTLHKGAPPQTGGFHQPGDPITVGIDERDHLVVGQPSPTAKKPRLCTGTRSRNATQESLCAVC